MSTHINHELPFLETLAPSTTSARWSGMTIDSLIVDALRREGLYVRASKAGWPVGIHFQYNRPGHPYFLAEVVVTAGTAPNTIVLGTTYREPDESFKPALDALVAQVIGQLNLLL